MNKIFLQISKKIRDFFGFSFVEIKGFWVLSSIILVVCVLPIVLINVINQPTFQKINHTQHPDLDTLLSQLSPPDTNTAENQERYRANQNYYSKNKNVELAPLYTFDPNKIPASQWQAWGVSKKVANNIKKYIDKGGKFRKNEDVKKTYGFKNEWYERLSPYMLIEKSEENFAKIKYNPDTIKEKNQKKKKNYTKNIFDINTADTAQLNQVKGIGEKTALSIVRYREKLGGFVSLEQLKEVFLLKNRPDVLNNLLSCVTLNVENIQKLQINEIGYDLLKSHPYIPPKLARIIINYRTQHGNFSQAEDLKKIKILADSTYQKILPYLHF